MKVAAHDEKHVQIKEEKYVGPMKSVDIQGVVSYSIFSSYNYLNNTIYGQMAQYFVAFAFISYAFTSMFTLNRSTVSGINSDYLSMWDYYDIALHLRFEQLQPYLLPSCKLAVGMSISG
jgi:hypothetical protein